MNRYEQAAYDRAIEDKIHLRNENTALRNVIAEKNKALCNVIVEKNKVLRNVIVEKDTLICQLGLRVTLHEEAIAGLTTENETLRRSVRILSQKVQPSTTRTCGRCGGFGHIASNSACPRR